MSEYLNRSDGPGSIGALKPLAALSHPPTIGSNDPRRNIRASASGPYGVPPLGSFSRTLGSCGSCGSSRSLSGMGTFENLPSWALPVGAVAAVAVGYYLYKRSKEGSGSLALNRYYY